VDLRESGYFRKEKISWPLPRFEPWIIQLELSIDNVQRNEAYSNNTFVWSFMLSLFFIQSVT